MIGRMGDTGLAQISIEGCSVHKKSGVYWPNYHLDQIKYFNELLKGTKVTKALCKIKWFHNIIYKIFERGWDGALFVNAKEEARSAGLEGAMDD